MARRAGAGGAFPFERVLVNAGEHHHAGDREAQDEHVGKVPVEVHRIAFFLGQAEVKLCVLSAVAGQDARVVSVQPCHRLDRPVRRSAGHLSVALLLFRPVREVEANLVCRRQLLQPCGAWKSKRLV
jgi:hypothetical protein